jgi:hypothetical protein
MSVIQQWVSRLPLMQQTVLLTAIRGPDGLNKHSPAKAMLRAYRRTILLSAMDGTALGPYDKGGGSFTAPCTHPDGVTGVMIDYIKGVDELPLHFHLHVCHAVEIVGYKHPENYTREHWNYFYQALCADMHVEPETVEQLDFRLGDNRENWIESQSTPLGAIIQ